MFSTNQKKEIELKRDEKLSFLEFLDGKSEKKVNLERILGIGGEGVVLAQKMDTRENHHKKGWEEKKGRDVALKFVKFKKYNDEDFLGPERTDELGHDGGINENGKWVNSQYFKRLRELGDFRAATWNEASYPLIRNEAEKGAEGGYSRPYFDFGISEIHKKYYYVIGKLTKPNRLNMNSK